MNHNYDLDKLIDQAIKAHEDQGNVMRPDTKKEVIAYLTKVFKQYLKDQGIKHDVIEAVLSQGEDKRMKKSLMEEHIYGMYEKAINGLQKELELVRSGHMFADDECVIIPVEVTWKLLNDLHNYSASHGLKSSDLVASLIKDKIEGK